MPLNPHAQTVIVCVPLRDTMPRWYATGDDRAEAEHYFAVAVADKGMPVPAYRVIGQRKVDQGDGPVVNGSFSIN